MPLNVYEQYFAVQAEFNGVSRPYRRDVEGNRGEVLWGGNRFVRRDGGKERNQLLW